MFDEPECSISLTHSCVPCAAVCCFFVAVCECTRGMFNAMLRHRIVIFEQFVVSIIVCVYTVIVMFEVNIVCAYSPLLFRQCLCIIHTTRIML